MEQNIPEVVRNTAKNMYELLMQLAAHIENLEKENTALKESYEQRTDDRSKN